MAKNKNNKGKKQAKGGFFSRLCENLTGTTMRFIVLACLAILVVYMASSFVSFVTSGGVDNSQVEPGANVDLNATDNGVEGCTGSLGARIAYFMINGCFGWAAFAIFPFFIALIVKLTKWRNPALTKWFLGSVFGLVWGSVFFSFMFGDLMAGSFMSPGGMHGDNVTNWLQSQIGGLGMLLLLLITLVEYYIEKLK